MPSCFNAAKLSYNTSHRLLCRGFLLLLTLALLACATPAQSEQATKRAEAERLFQEAMRLYREGSKVSLEMALQKFEQARPVIHSLNDSSWEAVALVGIGGVYNLLGEKQKALDNYALALPLFRAVGDRSGEATTLNNIGLVYNSIGEKQKALDNYALALMLNRAVGDRGGEATALTNMGSVFDSLGENQKALDNYALALPLFRADGDRRGEATTLNNIGLVYNSIGEKQKALDSYALALPLSRTLGDRRGEAITLSNMGLTYNSIGEKQKALDNYALALPLFRTVGDRRGEATALHNIGTVYNSIGEKQKALDNYMLALPLRRAVGDRGGEAATLNNIGKVYNLLGENQKALDSYSRALPLLRAVGDRSGEATALTGLGSVFDSLGEKQKALDNYAAALPLRRAVGDRGGEAVTLNNMAVVFDSLGEKQKALDNYALALPLFRAVGDRGSEAVTLSNVAYIERGQGRFTEARSNIEAAIAIIESLRTKIANQDLRASYFATVQGNYELYIDLLMRLRRQSPNAGLDSEALQASERARARALLETLAEANADIRQGVDPKLVERERALQIQLNAKAQAQMKLLSGARTDAQAKTMAGDIEALTVEFQQVKTQIRQSSPRYAALTQPQPLTLKEIQTNVLDRDTLLLEYSLGKERSYLWAVTPDSITSYELPKRDEIESAARRVYDILNARNLTVEGETPEQRRARIAQAEAQYVEAAAQLSSKILAPVAKQLGNKRLLVVADGVLQYIPFAALPDPSGNAAPLVVKHEIVSLPSASTISVLRREIKDRKPAAKAVAVLADPVFEETDERVKSVESGAGAAANRPRQRTRRRRDLPLGMERSLGESGLRDAGFEIPRLPGTREEAGKILALVPQSESKQAFDFNASRAAATASDLAQYRFIHFATHGFLNSLHPELSGIVLSMVDEKGTAQDGFLRANDIFNLKLPAELVVLSACQTGLGKEIKGEGLVGLTRGFMYAGAPRVVVSLWSVSDAGTAELMTRFYRGMLKEGRRPAAALREAQISLMKNRRWESPFYWAAFTLQGEWR
jgi:CHAT domain-containing protein/predicted negative regulator of RcsB-dependent stress response